MKHLIVGTAGHIDHGKTTLIRALTGIETDRLKEEKTRGITIELGFAYLIDQKGQTIGFVDVPGHEKFVKAMMAGATGIDAFLIVVAANEGIMPQTLEHMQILSHLGVDKGILVISKSDLVTPDQLSNLKKDIKSTLSDYFDAQIPILFYSAFDPHTLDAIRCELDELVNHARPYSQDDVSRLSIDRVFTVKGIGTVVTGTLTDGLMTKGETLWLYPNLVTCRIKGIQVHHESVETVEAGYRVALNLDIDHQDVKKGMVLSSSKELPITDIIDCEIQLDHLSLQHFERIRLFIGTREVFGRIFTSDKEPVEPMQITNVQVRLESPITCLAGDAFILRRFSPLITLGGGRVINPLGSKRHMVQDVDSAIIKAIDDYGKVFKEDDIFLVSLMPNASERIESLKKSVQNRECLKIDDRHFISAKKMDQLIECINQSLMTYHKDYPLKWGMGKAELKNKCFSEFDKKSFDLLLSYTYNENLLKVDYQHIHIPHVKPFYTDRQLAIRKRLIQASKTSEFTPIAIKMLVETENMGKNDYDIFNNLLIESILVKINEDTVMNIAFYEQSIQKLKEFLNKNKQITVAEFRDLMTISRKASVMLLEHYDSLKITKRNENYRVLINQ